ncbi:hypothetical protein Tco_0809299 [Tanacetum coccineum]
MARSCQKSYADVRRKPMEFQVGDMVMLKVSPWKGVIRFGKRGKLSPWYIGPFKIIERIGPVAYKLELPDKLRGIHHTFHYDGIPDEVRNTLGSEKISSKEIILTFSSSNKKDKIEGTQAPDDSPLRGEDLTFQLGEGSTIPTDPHHTPTITQSSTQPQKTQKPRKPKRKDTYVPQPSDPIENVADEAVHKELGKSLVRATTTDSSLETEQDSGNITKTRSKAIPNESSSLGTTSGGGPRRQETMRDTIAQTRFENVSKHSNDSLLARGNTLQSDEDRLKLNELMELCTNLQTRVLDLEKTKTDS